jgi:fibronectin-binding autotransporter adhesin
MPAGSTFTVQSGSSLTYTDNFFVGGLGNNTLNVTGPGSLLSINSELQPSGPVWGQNGFTADVTVASQATMFFGVLGLSGVPANPTSSTTFNILSGAQATGRSLQVGNGSVGTGTLNISGTNSKLTLTGALPGVGAVVPLIVGGTGTSTGTINVNRGGTRFVPTV